MLTAVRRFLGFDLEVRPPSITSVGACGFFPALDRFQRDAFHCLRLRYPEPGMDFFCKLVALKAANALAADYHFRNRHSALVSRQCFCRWILRMPATCIAQAVSTASTPLGHRGSIGRQRRLASENSMNSATNSALSQPASLCSGTESRYCTVDFPNL